MLRWSPTTCHTHEPAAHRLVPQRSSASFETSGLRSHCGRSLVRFNRRLVSHEQTFSRSLRLKGYEPNGFSQETSGVNKVPTDRGSGCARNARCLRMTCSTSANGAVRGSSSSTTTLLTGPPVRDRRAYRQTHQAEPDSRRPSRTASRHSRLTGRRGGFGACCGAAVGPAIASFRVRPVTSPLR
jgi:hypothetical protein